MVPLRINCAAASAILLRLQPLLDTIDPPVELIETLAIILRLPGCGLRLCQCRLGRRRRSPATASRAQSTRWLTGAICSRT